MSETAVRGGLGGLLSKIVLAGSVAVSSLGLSGCADIAWGKYQRGEISYQEFKQVNAFGNSVNAISSYLAM